MPTVLITGGAGFLGFHLCERLLAAGYRVRLLDCLDPQVHPGGRAPALPAEAELRVADVQDADALAKALTGVDAVVHFAAVVGVGQSMYEIARYHATNVQGTAVLLQSLLEAQMRPGSGARQLLLAGSMSLYGEGRYYCPDCARQQLADPRGLEQLRQQRWEVECPDCGHPLRPVPTDEAKPPQLGSYYALTKAMQEHMCLLFGRTYGMPTTVLRFFNTYGPRQALTNPYTGVAAVFAGELLGRRPPLVFEDGRQLRDLVSVHDVTTACLRALESGAGGVFNIASGTAITIADLARRLAVALELAIEPLVSGRYRLGDARHCIADISAARQQLGFVPRVGLEEGLRELGEWLRAQQPAAAPQVSMQVRATAELMAWGLSG